ncbi:heavy-metal-associated domain-containing protein [Geomonas sp. RF6]|uniref:heavy-metal-associated domain-containing protein n=1 Tax=Geomonas sp. RF6 TaxID=2897342 RepID=UPI001E40765D|nr:heavy-metal-associated domain-containing protein [Geomonas sp. RF6]UFS69811.1 heavy-metal-associated domain-containing protein [Geomonas sp. RF6]
MKSKKLFSAVLIITVVVLLGVLASYVRVGATADSVAILETKGMTCGSCSKKISTALQKLKGVAVTEVDVEGGWVIVGYDKKALQPDALVQKVTGAGFKSNLYAVVTPEHFKQVTGREVGKSATATSGCCGKGGCGGNS